MQFIRISSACATAAGVTSSVTRMPVTAESGSPHQQPYIIPRHAPPKGASMSMALYTFPAVYSMCFSPSMVGAGCPVGAAGQTVLRTVFRGLRPRTALRAGPAALACPLHLLFSLCSRGSAAHTPNSSRIRFTAASASSRLPYGSSVKPRLPDTMAESRRLSLGRYRI